MPGEQRSEISRRDFLRQHKNKFDRLGLTAKQREQRWTSYVRSTEGQRANRDARLHASDAGRVHVPRQIDSALSEKAIRMAVRYFMEKDAFLTALADPFEAPPARFPTFMAGETSVYQVKFNLPVVTDFQGNAFFFMRPSAGSCYALSDEHSWAPTLGAGGAGATPGSVVFNATAAMLSTAGMLTANPMPKWCEGGDTGGFKNLMTPSIFAMSPAPSAESVSNLFSQYRITAAACRFKYSGAPTEAKGNVCVGEWKGSYNAPHVRNYTLSLKASAASGAIGAAGTAPVMDLAQSVGPAFEVLERLEESEIYPAIDGFTQRWKPNDMSGAAKFRPMRYVPGMYNPESVMVNGANDSGSKQNDIAVTVPPICSTDPDLFRAYTNLIMSLNPYGCPAFVNGGLVSNTGIPVWARNNGLLWNDLEESGASTATNAGKALIQALTDFNDVEMADSDMALCAIWKGCQAQTQIGTIEVVINYEGIDETRALSFEAPAWRPKARHPIHDIAVRHMPASTKGTGKVHAGNWVKDVVGTVKSVAEGVVDAAPAVAEALGAIAAFF